MVEAFAYETLSLEDGLDEQGRDDVEGELAAQLALAQSQRVALEGLLKLERGAVLAGTVSIGLALVAFAVLVFMGLSLLKSFPMAPLFVAPFLWHALQNLRSRQNNARNLLSLEARLASSIQVAEDARISAAQTTSGR